MGVVLSSIGRGLLSFIIFMITIMMICILRK
jgi:hypothetical protein